MEIDMADNRFDAAFGAAPLADPGWPEPQPEPEPEPEPEAAAMQDAEFGTPSPDYEALIGSDEKFDRLLLERYDAVEDDRALDWLAEEQADKASVASTPFIGDLWRSVKSAAGKTVLDIVGAPKQIVGGARDAGQSMLDFIEWAGDEMPGALAAVGLPTDPEESVRLRGERNMPILPEIGEPAGALGNAVRGVTQFARWR